MIISINISLRNYLNLNIFTNIFDETEDNNPKTESKKLNSDGGEL